MHLSYKKFTTNQEAAELLPNELALGLARTTGLDHYPLHQELLALNPEVSLINGAPCLAAGDAAAVLLAVDSRLLRAVHHMVAACTFFLVAL